MEEGPDPATGLSPGQKPLPKEYEEAFGKFAANLQADLGNKFNVGLAKGIEDMSNKVDAKLGSIKLPLPSVTTPAGALNVAKLPLQQPEAFCGSGNADVRQWLDKVERYMRLAGVSEARMGEFAVTFLKDQAYTVFLAEEKVIKAHNEVLNFERFKSCMLKHYATLMPARTARVEYDSLKQTGTVAAFVRDTKRIAHELVGTSLAASNGERISPSPSPSPSASGLCGDSSLRSRSMWR
jgi:hypothetical protein